jgi:long-chain fatty acid transport protein
MRKLFAVFGVLGLVLATSPTAFASTNGTNLIGIGPIARSMGGVGIAAPQDAISAVFANPAAMCFGAYCPGSEFNFAGTLFRPKPEAKVSAGGVTASAQSDEKIYNIPAIGLSVPIPAAPEILRFGLAAYGVSGLGVDYRDTKLDQPVAAFGGNPLAAGTDTQLQTMKFAPALAYQPTDRLSLGLDLQVDYSSLDLGSGSTFNYGWGYQLGVLYRLTDAISLGATYISPQKVKYENVLAKPNGFSANLELESPQQVGFGVAFTLFDKLLLEGDVRWLNWSDAQGFHEFDWDDQWVYALGAQYEVIPKLFLRAGVNYGSNPVKRHQNFNGTTTTTVQGTTLPTYYYETFRIIGFPAIVETHLTAGIGYEFSPKFGLHLGYAHAFENKIKETGTGLDGGPASMESKLYEDSLELGLTWRF